MVPAQCLRGIVFFLYLDLSTQIIQSTNSLLNPSVTSTQTPPPDSCQPALYEYVSILLVGSFCSLYSTYE